jgi:hypothetical protein
VAPLGHLLHWHMLIFLAITGVQRPARGGEREWQPPSWFRVARTADGAPARGPTAQHMEGVRIIP